jgi:hypothetical protein
LPEGSDPSFEASCISGGGILPRIAGCPAVGNDGIHEVELGKFKEAFA